MWIYRERVSAQYTIETNIDYSSVGKYHDCKRKLIFFFSPIFSYARAALAALLLTRETRVERNKDTHA